MNKFTAPVRRNIVDIDTRRSVVMSAQGRKPSEVMEVAHEQFIRNTLKDKMGWPRSEPAPEAIKVAAREMALRLVSRDQAAAVKQKARDEQAAKDAAVAQGIADNV